MKFIKTMVTTGLLALALINSSQIAAANQDLATGIVLKAVTVTGNTVFTEADLDGAMAAEIGETVYIEDILGMVDAITALYVEAGYITSGAVLPDQDVADGRIIIAVIEGQLNGVKIKSSGRLKTAFIESKINATASGPLNLADLQKAISRLEAEPTISHVRGDLKPGETRGASILDLEVVEADAFKILVGADNYKSPSVGEGQAVVSLVHLNLLGYNDQLTVSGQQSDGVDALSVRYDVPISVLRSRLAVYHNQGDSLVVEEPFDEIFLESETDTSGIQLTSTWREDNGRSWRTNLSWETKESLTTLLGLPFDFSPGSRGGVTEASVLGFNVEYSQRGDGMGFMVRAGLRSGNDDDSQADDGDFSLYQVQAQWIKRLNQDPLQPAWLLNFNLNYQETSDTLPAFERMGLGGHGTVRGFRENRWLKDSGLTASLMLSAPLLQAGSQNGIALRAMLFYDYGRGENSVAALNVDTKVALSSAGFGLTADYQKLTFRIERALRLNKKNKLGNALQDSGIHVGVTYEL
ncbi:MAG: ShlB/FhaC/HecB family hemolysin secretion/activation protein [Pseudomonadales bacterium]|nr:ShlB/FhaC/HecB family hemolysin secretion/activation protein [Pseudomonadales bacterium]